MDESKVDVKVMFDHNFELLSRPKLGAPRKPDPARCIEPVWKGYGHHQCGNKAKQDGFCMSHHPQRVADKRAARNQRWNDEWTAKEEARQAEKDHTALTEKALAWVLKHGHHGQDCYSARNFERDCDCGLYEIRQAHNASL